MSIRKISDLPFADLQTNMLSGSILELTVPQDADSQQIAFASNAIMSEDFKAYVVHEVSANREFPNGIYVSSFVDVVGTVNVNTKEDSSYPNKSVAIHGVPVTVTGSELTLSGNSIRLYAAEGGVGVYANELDEVGVVKFMPASKQNQSSYMNVPTTTTTTFSRAPYIAEAVTSILAKGNSAAVNRGTLEKLLDNVRAWLKSELDKLGTMSKCDYYVGPKGPAVANHHTFYFQIQNYGNS